MKYNRLGNSGLIVSKLAFGAGALGVGTNTAGLKKNIPEKMAMDIVAKCLDSGVTLFDVADIYLDGQSEMLLGKSLGARRKDVVVCTKTGGPFGPNAREKNFSGLTVKHIIQSCQDSLKRLNTDWIDIFYCHGPDNATPMEESARAYEYLIQSGMARYIAVSNYPAWMAAHFMGIQAKLGNTPIVANQIFYSLLGRMHENYTVPFAQSSGMGLISYEALAGGMLTGKYTKDNPAPPGTRRAMFTRDPQIDVDLGYEVSAALLEMAPRYHATAAQLALAWTMSKPWMNSVIFGVSKMEQLVDNLGAADINISEEDLAKLDAMTTPPA